MKARVIIPALRQLTSTDTTLETQALELLNRTQGEGLFGPDYLKSRFGNSECLILVALHETGLVGVGIVEIIKSFDYFLPFVPDLDQRSSAYL